MLCNTCIYQVNENEEIEANLSLLKRTAPNQFGHLLPFYVVLQLFSNI